MRLHRFIVDVDLNGGSSLEIFDQSLVDQLRNVLRLTSGDELFLCDGNLNEARVVIKGLKKDSVVVEIVELFKNKNELKGEVTLCCSILKKENFELVVQKATEIGVSKIVPLVAKRTVKMNIDETRLLRIAKEAAEQSGRGRVPKIMPKKEFEEAIKDSSGNNANIFFDPSGEVLDLKKLDKFKNTNPMILWVGPEGGWDSSEIQMARDNGFSICGLGNLTYRAETAAIVASYISTIL